MDEMSLASIPLCEKSKAPAAKTTMSVREMQHLLGLGKTESYCHCQPKGRHRQDHHL